MFFTQAASTIGKQSDGVSLTILLICVGLFCVIIALMLYFAYRYHGSRHPVAAQIKGSRVVEAGWTAGAAAIVLLMFSLGLGVYSSVRGAGAGAGADGAYEIKVRARMWAWSFEYPDGRQSTVLNLQEGAPVKISLTSDDVIHSFYVPAFRVKQDAVPGTVNSIWFTPDEQGEYDLFCTEYCGLGHSLMLTKAVVMGEKEFSEWGMEKAAADGAQAPEAPEAPQAPKAPEDAAPPAPPQVDKEAAPAGEGLAAKGEKLVSSKGCIACHSVDGSKRVGPSFKGIYGHKVKVKTDGRERELTVDEDYIRRSIADPGADIVAGFPAVMPKLELTQEETEAVAAYIKSLR